MNKLNNKSIDICELNKNNCFLHYTNVKNINSIFKLGLEPRIGKNAITIEKNKKVFFTIGFDNTLYLMDVWIKWLVLRPRSNFIYSCGACFMKKSYFPKFIIDYIWRYWIHSKSKVNYACKKLYKILNKSVFLLLDLEENIDYKFDDIDEVKNQKFSRRHLKYIYNYKDDDVNSNLMEKWNMHTLVGKSIEKEKITLVKYKDITNANELLKYMIRNSNINFQEETPFLNKYIKDYISIDK